MAKLQKKPVGTGSLPLSYRGSPRSRGSCVELFEDPRTQVGSLGWEDPLEKGVANHASNVMLKILQARLQQYVNCELPGVQAGFRKGRGPSLLFLSPACICQPICQETKAMLPLLLVSLNIRIIQ